MPVLQTLRSLGPLLLLTLAASLMQMAYVAVGIPPSNTAVTLWMHALAFFLVLWVLADARQRRCAPCFDFGSFLLYGFPISILWYLEWSRSVKGLLFVALFLSLCCLPWLSATFVWVVLAVRW